jgi:hypothetical protein
MRIGVLVAVLGFLALFAGLTLSVVATSGLDPLTVLSLLLLALIAVPLVGALLNNPPDDE